MPKASKLIYLSLVIAASTSLAFIIVFIPPESDGIRYTVILLAAFATFLIGSLTKRSLLVSSAAAIGITIFLTLRLNGIRSPIWDLLIFLILIILELITHKR